MKHILVIPGSFPSEAHPFAGIFFEQLTDALQETGYKMGVIAPEIRSARALKRPSVLRDFGKFFTFETTGGVPVFRKTAINLMPGVRAFDRNVFVSYSQKLFKKYIAVHGLPQVIHAHTALYAGIAAHKLSIQYGIPYIITEHSSDILRNRLNQKEKELVKQVYKGATSVIAVSEALQTAIAKGYQVQAEVVPNMVNFNTIPLSNGEANNLVTIGNLLPVKGYNFLLEAFAKCLKEESILNLCVIGDGIEKQRLVNLSKELGIENRISFRGALSPEKIRAEIHKYGIFISSSLYETFGVALVEALGAGMPAVATKSGGPEGIITSKNGRLAETANAESLSNEILYVYRNYNGYDRNSIRQDVIERFGKEKCTQKMKKIIDGLN